MTGLKKLFSTYNIGTMTLKNRIVMGPMGTNLSNPDGSIAREEIAYYEARAKGGAGMIITEMVVFDQRGKYQPRIPMISNDGHIQGWKSLAESGACPWNKNCPSSWGMPAVKPSLIL